MTGFKTLMLAALISTISVTSVLAQEPAAFQSMFPNRDVLNGGALTPAGRSGLEQDYGAAGGYRADIGYAGAANAGPSLRAPALSTQRRRKGHFTR
jgi:hypothetical protein